jgi:hypothetical protein
LSFVLSFISSMRLRRPGQPFYYLDPVTSDFHSSIPDTLRKSFSIFNLKHGFFAKVSRRRRRRKLSPGRGRRNADRRDVASLCNTVIAALGGYIAGAALRSPLLTQDTQLTEALRHVATGGLRVETLAAVADTLTLTILRSARDAVGLL